MVGILPWLHWKYSRPNSNIKATDKKCKRFNTTGRQMLRKQKNVKYDITTDCPGLFRPDGCHLSDTGIALFCNTLQGAIQTFLSTDIKVFGP